MGDRAVGAGHRNSYINQAMAKDNDTIGGTPRARARPPHVKPPTDWVNSPIPEPAEPKEVAAEDQPGGRNPVRYGDWEHKGIAIDF